MGKRLACMDDGWRPVEVLEEGRPAGFACKSEYQRVSVRWQPTTFLLVVTATVTHADTAEADPQGGEHAR